jgi:hypothetical protein
MKTVFNKPKPPLVQKRKYKMRKAVSKKAAKAMLAPSRPKVDESNLTPLQIERFELFTSLYLRDMNASNAVRTMLAMGKATGKVSTLVHEFLSEPFVHRNLWEYRKKIGWRKALTEDIVVFRLWEEANREGADANSASRIAAIKEVIALLGLRPADRVDAKVELTGGGVMKIPIAATIEEWESAAKASQKSLKKKAKE